MRQLQLDIMEAQFRGKEDKGYQRNNYIKQACKGTQDKRRAELKS